VSATTASATVADASITVAKFASGIRPVETLSALPTSGNSIGRIVYLTTDGQLYRYTSSGWTISVPATAITGTITATQIGTDSITTPAIATGAITSDTIATNAITAGKISALAVTAGTIAAGAVRATEIASNAITTDKIYSSAISADKLAVNSVDATKIVAGSIGSNQIAANSILAGHIQAGVITATQIAASAITSSKIAANSITSGLIQAGAITSSQIATAAITADKIAVGALTVNNITSGTSNISGGSFSLGGSANIAGYSATTAFTSNTSSKWAMLASSTAGNAVAIATSQSAIDHTGWACGVYNCKDSTFSSFNSTAYFCKSNMAASFMNGISSKGADIGTSAYGVYLYGGAGPFTGSHDALLNNNELIEVGDIIIDTGFAIHLSVSDCITSVTKSTSVNQKGVVGVYVAKTDTIPVTLSEKEIDSKTGNISYIINPEYETLLSEYDTVCINSIGEGLVNVCGEGGNIEVGDAITTSSIPGKGMKQSDDLIHTYTVAKAREAVTFTDTTTSKQIACIYVAG
jgi:hypothetical protein